MSVVTPLETLERKMLTPCMHLTFLNHRSSVLPLLTPKTTTGGVLLKELLLKVLQYSLKADHTSQTTI